MKLKNPIPRSIWIDAENADFIEIIDQRFLPHQHIVNKLETVADTERAIRDMEVRGAPLIGITAAFGLYLSVLRNNPENWKSQLASDADFLRKSRPTAVNLMWAIDQQLAVVDTIKDWETAKNILWKNACVLMEDDAEICRRIGEFGLALIKEIAMRKPEQPVNILTHCNAGSLACIEWGTATSPIYQAHLQGIKVHVWVDETRPRNQGAQLTAWELNAAGVPHTLVVDNAGGHLMQHGMVDIVLVGTDRTTRNGDVANKIGTYLKALAAHDNHIPFYVALPISTIDWNTGDGVSEIVIEERTDREVRFVQGKWNEKTVEVQICPDNTPGYNVGFDVTPARLITGFITENGICEASEKGLASVMKSK